MGLCIISKGVPGPQDHAVIHSPGGIREPHGSRPPSPRPSLAVEHAPPPLPPEHPPTRFALYISGWEAAEAHGPQEFGQGGGVSWGESA